MRRILAYQLPLDACILPRVPCENPRPCDSRTPVTDMKQANRRTGGQVLVDALRIHGVDTVFCVPGESYLAALDALHDARGAIATITCRHEGGAGARA